jgi:signal recognition particle subunit SRP54
LTQIRKMGSLKDILGMIPGLGKIKALKDMQPDDKELIKITAIIDSMTPKERFNYLIIDGRRRKRIALGSGTSVQDVNKLLKNYAGIRKMMKNFNRKDGIKSFMRNFPF